MAERTDFLFLEKPHGWATHSPGETFGLHEWAENLARKKFFVCHRLDRDTSGAIVFAKNIDAARELGRAFENHEVLKSYFFVTKAKTSKSKLEHSSFIEKSGKQFISHQNSAANSFTSFEKINSFQDFELWRAMPKSGKPHQIRLHAQALGLPILGDREHGGAAFRGSCFIAIRYSFKNCNFFLTCRTFSKISSS